ncbi:Uncharacterised protein g11029 [Pycnogonum litorale]
MKNVVVSNPSSAYTPDWSSYTPIQNQEERRDVATAVVNHVIERATTIMTSSAFNHSSAINDSWNPQTSSQVDAHCQFSSLMNHESSEDNSHHSSSETSYSDLSFPPPPPEFLQESQDLAEEILNESSSVCFDDSSQVDKPLPPPPIEFREDSLSSHDLTYEETSSVLSPVADDLTFALDLSSPLNVSKDSEDAFEHPETWTDDVSLEEANFGAIKKRCKVESPFHYKEDVTDTTSPNLTLSPSCSEDELNILDLQDTSDNSFPQNMSDENEFSAQYNCLAHSEDKDDKPECSQQSMSLKSNVKCDCDIELSTKMIPSDNNAITPPEIRMFDDIVEVTIQEIDESSDCKIDQVSLITNEPNAGGEDRFCETEEVSCSSGAAKESFTDPHKTVQNKYTSVQDSEPVSANVFCKQYGSNISDDGFEDDDINYEIDDYNKDMINQYKTEDEPTNLKVKIEPIETNNIIGGNKNFLDKDSASNDEMSKRQQTDSQDFQVHSSSVQSDETDPGHQRIVLESQREIELMSNEERNSPTRFKSLQIAEENDKKNDNSTRVGNDRDDETHSSQQDADSNNDLAQNESSIVINCKNTDAESEAKENAMGGLETSTIDTMKEFRKLAEEIVRRAIEEAKDRMYETVHVPEPNSVETCNPSNTDEGKMQAIESAEGKPNIYRSNLE